VKEVATKWVLLSEAWSLNEVAHRAGEALTALTLLKLTRAHEITADEAQLRKRILSVKPVLQNLLTETEHAIKTGYAPPPLVRALQEEYGYADLRRVREKLKQILNTIDRIANGSQEEDDIKELERALECIANMAASRTQELIAKT